MKIYAPKYYKDFVCIADKCKHSCCIGWEIDIDPDTEQKYVRLKGGYGDVIKDSIERTENPHFRLRDDERCPHLSDTGLCKIICEYGDGYLCDICREHPRFYNFPADSCYAGLGLACEEACRLILSSDGYDELYDIDDTPKDATCAIPPHLAAIFGILSDDSIHHSEKLSKIHGVFKVSPSTLPDEAWHELLSGLEYLDDSHRELFSCYSSDTSTPPEHLDVLRRALAYFVYRHCAIAEDEGDLRASLGFCLFCERLLASVLSAGAADAVTTARIISEELEYSEDNTEAIKNEFLLI